MKVLLLSLVVIFSSNTYAQRAKKMELVTFVKEATEFAKNEGKEKACDEFTNGSKYKRGEFYIFAYDYKGTVLCHGGKKALVGKNLIDLKDKKGNLLIQELIKKAQLGSGNYKYYWEHPESKEVKLKLGYVESINKDWWIGSGIYYEEKN